MAKSNIKITFGNCDQSKAKIIAITGKCGSGYWEVYSWLKRKLPVSELPQIKAGDNCTTDLFLQKIINGDIVEATQDKTGAIWGIDASMLLTEKCVYIIVLSPERLSRLCESDKVEVLPIYCSMPAAVRLSYLINPDTSDKEVNRVINEFIEDEKEFGDIDELLDEDITFFAHFRNHIDLADSLHKGQFIDSLREWDKANNIFTNLDNFI